MANNTENLPFLIDLDELTAVKQILGATEQQMLKAYNRALSRTAVTINKLALSQLKEGLQPRRVALLRKRLKHFKIKKNKGMDELRLWFGLNDVPLRHLKGGTRRIGSKKNPKGAIFTPKGDALAPQTFSDAFVARINGQRSIFKRVGAGRYPVKNISVEISNELQTKIEDEIFDQLPDIFFKHFETDLKGRVKMNK